MKAVISTTYDDSYLFFLPLVCWCWNKLGVDVICFLPAISDDVADDKQHLIVDVLNQMDMKWQFERFVCPEHKEATYAQCSRLYAACLGLPEYEMLITSDVDMALFTLPYFIESGSGTTDHFTVWGGDLVPEKQYPICYISSSVKQWRNSFDMAGKTYQQCLDDLLGHIEAEHFRGNYWGKDQEEAFNRINGNRIDIKRARPGTQFASRRYDRDDAFLLERLHPDTIDYHMPRPGYEENNFNQILTVLKYHYPYDNFDWLIEYKDAYKKLL